MELNAHRFPTTPASNGGNTQKFDFAQLLQAMFSSAIGSQPAFIMLQVTFEQRETKHRVIIGKEYYEPYGLEPELVVERVFSFLLAKRVQRQTEGRSSLTKLQPAKSVLTAVKFACIRGNGSCPTSIVESCRHTSFEDWQMLSPHFPCVTL